MAESEANSYFHFARDNPFFPPTMHHWTQDFTLNKDEKITTADQKKEQFVVDQTSMLKEPLWQPSVYENDKKEKNIVVIEDNDTDDEVVFLCSSPRFNKKSKAHSPKSERNSPEKQTVNGKRPPAIDLNENPVKKLHTALETKDSSSDGEVKIVKPERSPLKPRVLKSFWGPCMSVTKVLAIDCEMVKVEGNALEVVRCSIVNSDGHVVFDHMIKPQRRVIDYVTWIHGIDRSQVENCHYLEHYQDKIFKILQNAIIVGHSLKVDFQVLGFQPKKENVRDLAHYAPMRENNCAMSLRNLVFKYLHADIQKSSHNSVEDARAAMALYTKFGHQWEKRLKEVDEF